MKVVIVGVGTTAMIVADIIMESHNFNLAGFIGTSEEEKTLRSSNVYHDLPFLGNRGIVSRLKEGDISGFICAIGDVYIREKAFYECGDRTAWCSRLRAYPCRLRSDVVHPKGEG